MMTNAMESTTYCGGARTSGDRAPGATALWSSAGNEILQFRLLKKRAARIWPASRAEKYASSTKATQSASVLSAPFVARIQGLSQRRTSMVAMRA